MALEYKTVVTVSQLNRQVKSYLETELGVVHVKGEISNLSKPSSGHFYFCLKDNTAQIRCVFFKNHHLSPLKISLKEGQQVVASGRLSLYEARGEYQLIITQLTDAGLGELYQRFIELKNKLALEGLFNPERKKSIPIFPRSIGIITSPTSAALQDMLSTLKRRFALANIFIYPSEVQGTTAPQQLIKSLQKAIAHKACDVLIIARGGGSIEDLWAFNDEELARHIAACPIPFVSGVGHETDFTIADFVADYRAETPTAAATAVTPNAAELLEHLDQLVGRLHILVMRCIENYLIKLEHLKEKMSSPRRAVASFWQTLDYLEKHLFSCTTQRLKEKKHKLQLLTSHLESQNPCAQIMHHKIYLQQILERLVQNIKQQVEYQKNRLAVHLSTLHAVSPLATLDRGYAIATHKNKILFSQDQIHVGDKIEVRLSKGKLSCEVLEIKDSL